MKGPIRRLVVALTIAVILNFILMTVASVDPRILASSATTVEILNVLGAPAGAFTEWVLPGHAGIQVVLMIASSILFYTMVAWVILASWSRIRKHEVHNKSRQFDGDFQAIQGRPARRQ